MSEIILNRVHNLSQAYQSLAERQTIPAFRQRGQWVIAEERLVKIKSKNETL